jgi:kynureninase
MRGASRPSLYAILQALIAGGAIGEFRAPDVTPFGFALLYTRYVDMFDAVAALADIMRQRSVAASGSASALR